MKFMKYNAARPGPMQSGSPILQAAFRRNVHVHVVIIYRLVGPQYQHR